MKTFLLLFCSNFNGRITEVILMHILDSTCFFWCVLKKKKIVVALSLISFRYFKNESRLAMSFRCNLISINFFKVISFHFGISYVIMQCLKTVTQVSICYDLICSHSEWFSANILWKFAGNRQRNASKRKASMRVFPFQ